MTEKFVGKFKSSEKSKRFLNNARELFDESRIFEALISLNRSLCIAENEGETAKCFELRGEIYFSMRKYEKCLKNIERSMKFENSEEKTELELICSAEIKKTAANNHENSTKNVSDFFKLSYPANPKNSSIVNCIKLEVNEIFGRHLVAKQDINAGDILIIEEPIHKSLDKNFTQGRCVNCFKSNYLDLLPCKYCCSVMFCSDECQDSAWDKFHKFECDSIDELSEEDNFLIMIQRTFFEIIHIFGNLRNMETFLGENLCDVTAFDIDMSDKVDLKKKLILIGQSLEYSPTTQEDFKFAESFVKCHKHVKTLWKTKKQRNFLVKFLVKFIGIMNRNAFTMHWTSPSNNIEEQGCAIFATVSMINHSCSPNLFRIRKDESLILIARKPIQANEQLFIAYQ